MTADELADTLGREYCARKLGYDVVHNGLIITAVVVNHDDRTIELVTE